MKILVDGDACPVKAEVEQELLDLDEEDFELLSDVCNLRQRHSSGQHLGWVSGLLAGVKAKRLRKMASVDATILKKFKHKIEGGLIFLF